MDRGDADLTSAWDDARRVWPGIDVPLARYTEFLRERVVRAGGLAALHARDLYLACACLDEDASALRAFDALLDEVGRKLRFRAGSDEQLDDAKQLVRHVLVARGERSAPLADYSGRGELGGWLRIALGRELLRVQARAATQPRADSGELGELIDADDDPESAYLKAHYEREFKEAFAAAMAALDDDERRLLRYGIVERLSIDEIGRLDGVHRATAARQLARARARLTEETRRVLRTRLRIDAGELDSVLRLIDSQVNVSVLRLLASS